MLKHGVVLSKWVFGRTITRHPISQTWMTGSPCSIWTRHYRWSSCRNPVPQLPQRKPLLDVCRHASTENDVLNATSWTSSWTPERTARYIRDVTEESRDHLTPELRFRLITPTCRLWGSRGEDCQVPDPFWAFYWPGGQALTRYVLDQPQVVRGRRVLDVGSGCGASAIAARVSGASSVTANDICSVAAEAIQLNASLNNVHLEVDTRNLIGRLDDSWDIIFLGDMFYDEDFTNHVTEWLESLHARGKTILIGDPGRVYFKKHPVRQRLNMVFSVDLLRHTTDENNGITQGFVWEFK